MGVVILVGDVFDRLADLPDDHFDCVVTSPPYWGLRDYGVAGQIGLEPTLGEHLDVMVRLFREVRRVLKPSGVVFLNYGDCYATEPNGRSAADTKHSGSDDRTFRDKPFSTVGPIYGPGCGGFRGDEKRGDVAAPAGRIMAGGTLKPGDLCMIPNRLAIALQDDGWWVRSEMIWGKPNAMPDSSGIYRPATAHEKVYLLTKGGEVAFWVARDTGEVSAFPDLSERCPARGAKHADGTPKIVNRWRGLGHYWDAESVRVGRVGDEDAATYRGGSYVGGAVGPRAVRGNKRPAGWATNDGAHGTVNVDGRTPADKQRGHSRRHQGFNDRWDQMDRADQMAEGRLLRNYEPAPLPVWEIATRAFRDAHFATFPPDLVVRALKAGCPAGGRVLDPFGGAGTVGLVAEAMGLEATLIELNPAYVEITERRLRMARGGTLTRLLGEAQRQAELDSLPLFGGSEVA